MSRPATSVRERAAPETLESLAAQVRLLSDRLHELEDREAIRDVLYRYVRGADRCDLELMKSTYWPDGTDCHWFFNGNAHAWCEYVIAELKQVDHSTHAITNPIIEIHGDRAFVESICSLVHHIELRDGTGRWIAQQGEFRYLDVFERRDGVWKILHRQLAIEQIRETVVTDVQIGDTGGLPVMGRRAPHDPVYRGMAILDDEIVPTQGMDRWADARSRHAQAG